MHKITIKETQPIAINRSVLGTSFTPSVEYSDGWADISLTVFFDQPHLTLYDLKFAPQKADTVMMEAHYLGDSPPLSVSVTSEKLDGTATDITGLRLCMSTPFPGGGCLVTYRAKSGEYVITERINDQRI